ncbi:S-layer protein domain-containing protein [Methanosarcina sp. UBA289]|uniref:S-layer protein domain-containing protein n=1 Tax=Methanosarcina sp. UBA289 TaxID=1915574 RepID=UPI0025EF425A|nr:S-layer protein domain-containing protein [Methanosarcina sp. UBA289]
MKKYKIVVLLAFTLLISIAVNTGSAADNNCSKANICNVVSTHYKCSTWSNDEYPVIDLFGEKNVPLVANYDPIWQCHINKLARLVLDSNATYTLKAGEKLDLGQGYALEVKQIDIDGMKVWLEFTKDGKYVADQILSVNTDSNKTWTVALDNVQGENNIVVMKVYVNQLFAGAVDNIVRIDGIWLIDYENARTLNVGDKIGGFTLQQIINGTNSSNPGSLVFEKVTEFPVSCNVVSTDYECDSWSNEQYPVIDLFGEKNVPLVANYDPIWKCHVDKLTKLVLDSGDKHSLKAGEKLDLCKGYSIQVKEIDVDGKKVWLEFDKNGKYVDDTIISTDPGDNNWTCYLDKIQGEDNVPVLKVHVSDVSRSGDDSIVNIDGIWLIDYANARTLKIGDKIGGFTLEKIVNGTSSSNLGSLVFEKITESPVSRNVVSTSYKCSTWSNERYPLINLFEEKNVPLVANYDPIWKCHVDKVARLVLDSSDKFTLKAGSKLGLGQGYSIKARQVDVDGKKVWLEFDKNGKYVDDTILSTGENWTCFLDSIQGEDHVPVLKVHISNVYQSGNDSIVQIDGIWLTDYANARTLNVGDKIGGFTLENIVNGVNKSNLGSLIFRKISNS